MRRRKGEEKQFLFIIDRLHRAMVSAPVVLDVESFAKLTELTPYYSPPDLIFRVGEKYAKIHNSYITQL